jgi:protein-S-isoprenylcysteine O-methyltransferase Ste14
MNLEAVMNLIIVTGAIALGFAVVISWLGSIHRQEAPRLILSGWFALPPWAQVILGIAAIGFFIWFGFLLWILIPLRLPEPLISLARPVGFIIFLAGLFLALWARWALGTMYGVSTGSSAPLREKHRIVQRGPYAFSRHPMYLGYWLVMFGVLLTYRTWTPLLLLIMTVSSFHRRARREEISLGEMFGEEWQAYVKHVPMFLPRWKKKSKENQ